MHKHRWILKESWSVEHGQRLIFKNSPGNIHMIDATITKDTAAVISKVEAERWSADELLQFLNQYSNTG